MGAIFGQPVVRAPWEEARAAAGHDGGAGPPRGRVPAGAAAWPVHRSSCWEPSAPGLPPEIVAACDQVAHVPVGDADSLNVAMTATLCLYEYRARSDA